jgi:hypothetical protein
MPRQAWALILPAMLIATTLPAAAGHGIPWSMVGTACAEELPECWTVLVEWGGNGVVRVKLTTSDGVELFPHGIRAGEEFNNFVFFFDPDCGAAERFDYRLADTDTNAVLFEVTGPTLFCLDGPLGHVMQGTYTGHYLFFDITIKDPRVA